MKPMLLCRDNPDTSKLPYPLYVSPKLDGIRCVTTRDGPKTRTLKPIPNKFIHEDLGFMSFTGLDGELIVGSPTDKDVFNKTTSAVRRVDGEPDYKFYVFDMWDIPDQRYDQRYPQLQYHCHDLYPERIVVLPSLRVADEKELLIVEETFLNEGYEGVIIRCPGAPYKYGRTTMKEQNTYKLKRFEDSEAYVIGMIPKYRNDNEAFTNELGRTARSKKAEGLVELNTMGALILRDADTGVEFQCGSGFTEEQRLWWFTAWKEVMKQHSLIVYKKFLIGEKDKPRHPIFKGIRMKDDI